MKRGAEAMDGRESKRNGHDNTRSRNYQSDHKRVRRADEGRNRIGSASATVKTLADEKETDPHRLAQRQKQIDYGKNTIGYDRYCAQVPRCHRRPGTHPMTPDKTMRIGKKVFDGIVRKWRQALHKYDPLELAEATKAVATESLIVASTDANMESVDASATITKSAIPEEEATTASSCVSSTASTELSMKNEAPIVGMPTPPRRSIYENFDEGNFDDNDDSDDDLL